jgi:hypothetical protein
MIKISGGVTVHILKIKIVENKHRAIYGGKT